MSNTIIPIIQSILNQPVKATRPLHGGSIAEVLRITLADEQTVVAKVGHAKSQLHIEAQMLRDLTPYIPVPKVLYSAPDLLLMSYVAGHSDLTESVQAHAADLLGHLHSITGESFGYPYDTLIGGLHQPNPPTDSWVVFFRDSRLLYMGQQAVQAGQLPHNLMKRLEIFATQLGDFIDEPPYPALIHGDMWTTNVLASQGRVAAFLDPAIYYAHPEVELAFSTLFGTFSTPFFDRYTQNHHLQPGFFETRRDIYNLYPLLVHVRLFGGGYVRSVERILSYLGF